MLRISSHIERLLFFNDCVIIPDFGGFVLQMHSAIVAPGEHIFRPPYKEIVFNPTLKHNDGLLSESYMQLYGMDYNEAQVSMKSDIDLLKKELDTSGTVLLGRVGQFRKENRVLLFEQGNDVAVFNISSYGLIPFYIPPAQLEPDALMHLLPDKQLQKEELLVVKESSGRSVLSPVNKVLSSVSGIAAATIAIFLLVSTPVKDVSKSAYTASFIPTEMTPKKLGYHHNSLENQETVFEDNIEEENKSAPNVTIPFVSSVQGRENTQVLEEDAVAVQTNNSSELKTEPVIPKTFYVIIASLGTKDELNRFLSKIVPTELENMGVVENNERIRVYANKTTDRKEAEEYMLLLRKNEKYKDAWLFIGR